MAAPCTLKRGALWHQLTLPTICKMRVEKRVHVLPLNLGGGSALPSNLAIAVKAGQNTFQVDVPKLASRIPNHHTQIAGSTCPVQGVAAAPHMMALKRPFTSVNQTSKISPTVRKEGLLTCRHT